MSTDKNIQTAKRQPDGYTLLGTGLSCPECSNEMEQIDTTYSNMKTDRCEVGQHTGDIYECKICEMVFINNMLNGKLEPWSY